MPNFLKGRTFNLILATAMALALAFAFLVMPDDLFGALVETTGIPALVPSAAPPLGETARLAATIASAIAGFLLVWLVLRSLDAPAATAADEREERDLLDASWQAPRVRRADAHPDAPTPRPILAGQEFGEPLESSARGAAESLDRQACPAEDPWSKTLELETVVVEQAKPTIAMGSATEPAAVEPAAAAEPPAAAEAEEPLAPMEEPSSESLMERLPLPADSGESVSSLLQRLDAGLANCEWPLRSVPPSASSPASPAGGDERLRSVLDDLQKLAARS